MLYHLYYDNLYFNLIVEKKLEAVEPKNDNNPSPRYGHSAVVHNVSIKSKE